MQPRTLDPRALGAARRGDGMQAIVAIGLVAAAWTFIPALAQVQWLGWVLSIAIGILTVVEIVVLEPRTHRAFSYRLGDRAVEITSGVLIRSRRHVPYRQVLIVERRVGPILRAAGIVAAQLRLADGAVHLPGIDEAAFEELRAAVEEGHRGA